jgi:Arc/MetJ-type ribon-helix-helix transcriptional regulator
MVRTQIQLTEKQAEKLKRLASQRGTSMAEIIRHAVDLIIESPTAPSADEIKQRAITAAGRFHAGTRLARDHDDHLSDLYR